MHLPAFLSIAVPLLAFIFILAGLNIYQYFKAKQNIASSSLVAFSNIETSEVQMFFRTVTTRLNEVREWGKNGLLQVDNVIELNKKMFPFMTSQNPFTGLLLADSTGSEYYLYRANNELVSRSSMVTKDETTMIWQQWDKPDQVKKKWQESSDYDPRKRPWFAAPQDGNSIHWTKAYTFFQSGKPGITASVSWVDPQDPHKYAVFGLDFLVESITELFTVRGKKNHTVLFWLNTAEPNFFKDTAIVSAGSGTPGTETARERIIQSSLSAWKAAGSQTDTVIPFSYGKEKWLVHITHLNKKNTPILIGVAASEKDLAAELKKILLQVDGTDLLVGTVGGLFLFFLAWRFGWRVTTSHRRQMDQAGLKKRIEEGENDHLEFKSTVRFNLRSGKTGKEIELAWLKAVTAFLNTEGGTLLIGVADDGTVIGTDSDNFENDDRCLLHVKNLVNQHIGAELSRFINIYLVALDNCRIVTVECMQSNKPVFLKVGRNEEFYIRSGPSNTKLTPSQLVSYLEKSR